MMFTSKGTYKCTNLEDKLKDILNDLMEKRMREYAEFCANNIIKEMKDSVVVDIVKNIEGNIEVTFKYDENNKAD